MASSDIMSLLSMYSPEDLAALLTGPAPASASETDDSGLMFDCSLSQAVHAQPQASDNGHAGPAYSCWQDLAAEHQSNLLQEMAQSFAVTLEQQRKQQQLAHQLRALQQQQDLATTLHTQLQSLSALPPQSLAYSRAFSNDLEYRPTHLSAAAAAYHRGMSVEFDNGSSTPRARAANALTSSPGQLGLPVHMLAASRAAGAPQRSFSSDMEPRRHPLQRGTPLHLANPPPCRAPGGTRGAAAPSARGPPSRTHSRSHANGLASFASAIAAATTHANAPFTAAAAAAGGANISLSLRTAATAKAPAWASPDWHPLKSVLASNSVAPAKPSTGTGVFLPHLSLSNARDKGWDREEKKAAAGNPATKGSQGTSSILYLVDGRSQHAADEVERSCNSMGNGSLTYVPMHAGCALQDSSGNVVGNGSAMLDSGAMGSSRVGTCSGADQSPTCSFDGISTCSDLWSRSSTQDLLSSHGHIHGHSYGHAHDTHAAHMASMAAGHSMHGMHMSAHQRSGMGPATARAASMHMQMPAVEEDEFGPLARELAELMLTEQARAQ